MSRFRIDPDPGSTPAEVAETGNCRDASEQEVPVIDVGPLYGAGDHGVERVASRIRDACERSGFFVIVNHDVAPDTVEAVFKQARKFFEQPIEFKNKIAFNEIQRGYRAPGTITIPGNPPDRKEVLDFGVEFPPDHPGVLAGRPLHGPNQWPDLDGFREVMERYYTAVCAVGYRLLPAFAVALELEPDFFLPFHQQPQITWRIMRYPPDDGSPGQFGTAPHTDFGTMTLLRQDDSGGLQVLLPNNEWVNVPCIENAFVVNIGDLMACWTNDRFTSTAHRVINMSGHDRYSVPLFYNPSFDTVAECLPSCQGPGNPPRYEPIHYGEYVTSIYNRIFSPSGSLEGETGAGRIGN